ncbi:SRPBCC family protein [Phycicoccus sonneratiae]|uniref:Carbon monoxide dehydrogenase subunit G n=1 Tax=Phycicoccus sonneratiae TaxID=2807628 RepID=A0ABS2CQ89_9MICO|nr:carbon monoxide dehydrogenase subunit G [Phycicoccus sonneraticus]MBM6402048.1 carbon monoxide dehydrogenase subunit G [Phycicoccus sonneraticus]
MKITGTSTLDAAPDAVWRAILDPAVLARCIPGCEALTTVGEDRYAMTVTAGVAAIKGTYTGEVALTDMQKPSALRLKANGAGGPGTIDADVRVHLTPSGAGGTDLEYEADATVGGTIGGVGQRMLAGVTRKMAGQFFSALDADIAGAGVGVGTAAPAVAADPTTAVAAGSPTAVGTTFAGRAATPPGGATGGRDLVLAAVAGGLLALAGVALGWRLGRRS